MRIIVSHPDQQHSYRLAAALKKQGALLKYLTTVYYKKKSWTFLFTRLLRGNNKKKAMNRYTEELNDEDVVLFCELRALVKLLFQNVALFKKFYNAMRYYVADSFSKKVAKYAIKYHADAVVTYDDCSPKLFRYLKKKAPNIIRILDVSAANREYLRKIFVDDLTSAAPFAKKLKEETPQIWNKKLLIRNHDEIELADYYLVASEFVIKSLTETGVKKNKILLCPYGVDSSKFMMKEQYREIKRPLRLIYVGSLSETKGIYYILEAVRKFSKEDVTLTMVGALGCHEELFNTYRDRVTFTGRVLNSNLPDLLKEHDVFVFPSLADSFSFACLEAASVGLPLIVTINTGMHDFMKDGEEGFVVPIQSTDAFVEKIKWFLENDSKIPIMGRKAREMAEHVSWDKYEESISNIIDKINNICSYN